MTAITSTHQSDAALQSRQIPIVCPGHTRPLAELQYLKLNDERRTLLSSACHGKKKTITVYNKELLNAFILQ
jgi:hypothetical protein